MKEHASAASPAQVRGAAVGLPMVPRDRMDRLAGSPEPTEAVPAVQGNGTQPGDWLTIRKAAEHVGVSRRTIYNWYDEGKLVTKRTIGGALRILASSLWRRTEPDKTNG